MSLLENTKQQNMFEDLFADFDDDDDVEVEEVENKTEENEAKDNETEDNELVLEEKVEEEKELTVEEKQEKIKELVNNCDEIVIVDADNDKDKKEEATEVEEDEILVPVAEEVTITSEQAKEEPKKKTKKSSKKKEEAAEALPKYDKDVETTSDIKVANNILNNPFERKIDDNFTEMINEQFAKMKAINFDANMTHEQISKALVTSLEVYDTIALIYTEYQTQYESVKKLVEAVKAKGAIGSNEAERKMNSILACEHMESVDEEGNKVYVNVLQMEDFYCRRYTNLKNLIDNVKQYKEMCVTLLGCAKLNVDIAKNMK